MENEIRYTEVSHFFAVQTIMVCVVLSVRPPFQLEGRGQREVWCQVVQWHCSNKYLPM